MSDTAGEPSAGLHPGDTIAAIATPAGPGGIGVLRISGPRAWEVGRELFRPAGRGGLPEALEPRRLYYGWVRHPLSGEPLDEVLCVFFRAPHSYTTEDCVEIQSHSGSAVLRAVLEAALEAGCRLARPGEFTLRAFLGGRLDLSQAEAVARLVSARSRGEARLALGSLEGGLARRLVPVRQRLLETAAAVEAAIDFPDEVGEIIEPGLVAALEAEVLAPLERLLERHRRRRIFGEGALVVLCGRPNVGKSCLFNALLGQERAIVTELPGTTRDHIQETLILGGVACRLADTAGLGEGRDQAEALGVAAARRLLEQADLLLVVLDGSRPLEAEDREVLAQTAGRPRLVVVNKVDLGAAWELEALGLEPGRDRRVRGVTEVGVQELGEAIAQALTGGQPEPVPGEVVASTRQAEALGRCLAAARRAVRALGEAEPAVELVSVDLAEALGALGEVDGEGAPDEVIEAVFSQFCVGK